MIRFLRVCEFTKSFSDLLKKFQVFLNEVCGDRSALCVFFKPATHLAILYADSRDQRKSSSVPTAAIAIFADRRDRRIKSPISGMSDIGD